MSSTKFYSALLAGLLAPFLLTAAEAIVSSETETLKSASQGSVIVLQDLWLRQHGLPPLPVVITEERGPQFLFSDKPEYFYLGDGISLQEEVKPGVVRLYLYHVPQPNAGPKTISAVVENLGTRPMKLRFLRRAFPAPGKNYHQIGKTGLIDFFSSKPESSGRRIPAKGRAVFDPQLDATTVTTDQLVHGFYEFEINQPARVTVFQRNPQQSSLEAVDTLPKLPRDIPGRIADGAGRGLFSACNFKVTGQNGFVLDTTNGPMRLMLADRRNDRYIHGRDSIAHLDSVTNNGNYGVMYHIRLKWRSSDGHGLALLMTRRGGNSTYCRGQAGAVQVSEGVWPGGIVAIPTGRVSYGGPGEMVIIQEFPAPKRGTGEIEITYSPPGASCIPTPMLLVPY